MPLLFLDEKYNNKKNTYQIRKQQILLHFLLLNHTQQNIVHFKTCIIYNIFQILCIRCVYNLFCYFFKINLNNKSSEITFYYEEAKD